MRRYLQAAAMAGLVVSLVLVGALCSDANAAAPPQRLDVAAWTAQAKAQATTMGMEYVGYRSAVMADGIHSHDWTFQSPPWVSSDDRVHRIRVNIGINHWWKTDALDAFQAKFNVECTRSYGGTTVIHPCNIDVNSFSALGFLSAGSETKTIFGTKNPDDVNCAAGNADVGIWRTPPPDRSVVMSYLAYIQVRFLTSFSACAHKHLSNTYRSGSLRVDIYDDPEDFNDYEEATWDNLRTGMFAT